MNTYSSHLHWQQTGQRSWQLREARVTEHPASYRGAIRWSAKAAYLRMVLKGAMSDGHSWSSTDRRDGTFLYQIAEAELETPPTFAGGAGIQLPTSDLQEAMRIVQERYAASQAADRLRGSREYQFWAMAGWGCCADCPPHVWERKQKTSTKDR